MADQQSVTEVQPGPVVVTFPVEVGQANAAQLAERLGLAFAAGASAVIADLTGTTSCDIAGARMLALAHLRAADNGTRLRLVAPGWSVRRVLGLTGLDRILPVSSDLDEACRAEAGPAPARPPA